MTYISTIYVIHELPLSSNCCKTEDDGHANSGLVECTPKVSYQINKK